MSHEGPLISRRQALWRSGMGMGALGLAGVLRGVGAVQADEATGQSSRSPLARPPSSRRTLRPKNFFARCAPAPPQ